MTDALRRSSVFSFSPVWRSLFCGLVFAFFSDLQAVEPPGYYNSAAGLSGTALRNALHNIIDDHAPVSYTNSRFALENLDEDPANPVNLILVYERTSWPKAQFASTTPGGWNREHCWPNSLGIDDDMPAYSDLFNLRACGETGNNDRSNKYYDESATSGPGYENPAGPTTPLCSEDFDSWEPPLEVKGDLARAMFYMDIRYEGGTGEPNLMLTDNVNLIATSGSYMGRLSVLLLWHFIDPVSPAEQARGEGAYEYQGNRNPFVDHPDYVERIYGDVFQLRVTRESVFIVLSWPAIVPTDIGIIETSSDLVVWTPANLIITDVSGRHTARVPVSNSRQYFRLKLQQRPG